MHHQLSQAERAGFTASTDMHKNDMEAELSYAYLHAVASRAGVACEQSGRLADGQGVDAKLSARGRFAEEPVFTDIELHVQLKATRKPAVVKDGMRSFFVGDLKQYDKYRSEQRTNPLVMVVVYLPSNDKDWLTQSEEQLILRRCAYWVSLRGAPPSMNVSGQTIYLPETQVFDVPGLHGILATQALGKELSYAN